MNSIIDSRNNVFSCLTKKTLLDPKPCFYQVHSFSKTDLVHLENRKFDAAMNRGKGVVALSTDAKPPFQNKKMHFCVTNLNFFRISNT